MKDTRRLVKEGIKRLETEYRRQIATMREELEKLRLAIAEDEGLELVKVAFQEDDDSWNHRYEIRRRGGVGRRAN